MSTRASDPTGLGFRATTFLLLRAARRRADGRKKRAREMLQRRTGRNAMDWGALGVFLAFLLGVFVNVMAAVLVVSSVHAGTRLAIEDEGKIPVSYWFLKVIEKRGPSAALDPDLESLFYSEAGRITREDGGSQVELDKRLRASVEAHGTRDLAAKDAGLLDLRSSLVTGGAAAMLGSLVLLWWCVMIVFQGEGLELDLQRRRHPMWEWLFSHPVPAGAVFLAEMLSPIAANPIYLAAPIFVGVLYGMTYGPMPGLVGGVVVGFPVTIAAACLGKALEIAVVLRFAPRSRGAIIGIMSWIGYASLMLLMLGGISMTNMEVPAGRILRPLTHIPWPWLGLFLGGWDGSFSFWRGAATCWLAAGAVTAVAVVFARWGAQQGLAGNFGKAGNAPPVAAGGANFGRDPLYKKELLWFVRDRSAVVQTILVPVTVAGFQMFNMRGLLVQANSAWNFLCGAGILFGTYFLWVLGPKSLASEGPALWIAMTWPRGMESLLKAKAWLWSLISSGIVVLVLIYAAWMYPADASKVLLVGVGWFFFGRSMAEKTVTLVRATDSSGEVEKPSRNRQWAASLGMLTFAIGILSQRWQIAIMGIVYSYITAAAMWENFRARLPFLHDPWSEKIPPPPTLMHAMIAISILVEVGAVFTGIAFAAGGKAYIAPLQAIFYAITAFVVSLSMAGFLSARDVSAWDVWCWDSAPRRGVALPVVLAAGVLIGVGLGFFARGYLAVIQLIPAVATYIHASQAVMKGIPGLHASYAFMAICIAPFAEEYLFRGLLFRALDREWGGWRAVLGSAAFFAIYHQPLAWLPVGLLGVANALIFKNTGRLAPAVLLHMAYNVVVTM